MPYVGFTEAQPDAATHTPTPWTAVGDRIDQSESGAMIAKCGPAFGDGAAARKQANAARIVKCVNAHDDLITALTECLNYIEHSAANAGKATDDAQWDANVKAFRERVSETSIGRSYVPKATVNLARVRALIADERTCPDCGDPMPLPATLHGCGR